jgi:hypothetical protein
MIGAGTSWVDTVSAVSAASSAAFVVVGGLWAFFRFRKEAPFIARANLELQAELLTHRTTDLIRTTCTASAIGQGKFVFAKGMASHHVAAYRMTTALVEQPPARWEHPVVTATTFGDDVSLEAGEVIEEVDLLWAGDRVAGTLAYRVVATAKGSDRRQGTQFEWVATVVVPVEALSPEVGGATPPGAPAGRTVEIAP